MDNLIKGIGTSGNHNGTKHPHNSQHTKNKTKNPQNTLPHILQKKKRMPDERIKYAKQKFKTLGEGKKIYIYTYDQAREVSKIRPINTNHKGNRLTSMTTTKTHVHQKIP